MRIGYAGQASASVAPGVTVGTIVDTADMGALDVLMEVAAQTYGYDTTAGNGLKMYTAKSLANGADGSRFLAQLVMLANGTGFDPRPGNLEGTLLTSGARTANTPTADQLNVGNSGVTVYLNITVASGTGGLQVIFQAKDPVTGTYANLNAGPTALTTTGFRAYTLHPGEGAAAGDIAQATSRALPRTWRVLVAVNDASSYTYSLGYALIR